MSYDYRPNLEGILTGYHFAHQLYVFRAMPTRAEISVSSIFINYHE